MSILASYNDRGVSVISACRVTGRFSAQPRLRNTTMFHAGAAPDFGAGHGAVNPAQLGIEIVQKADLSLSPIYPEAQVRAVAELWRTSVPAFNLTRGDITTHARIIQDGSRSDPRQFPFTRFDTISTRPTAGAISRLAHSRRRDTLFALASDSDDIEKSKAEPINDASNMISVGQV